MKEFITHFSGEVQKCLEALPQDEIVKALNILQACYERGGNIYAFGNGGSFGLASHWVSDISKTAFSHHLDRHKKRFKATLVPSSNEELTAWANDVGYDMVFAGPLANYLQESDVVMAISSSGNSPNIIKAVELAKERHTPVIGLSGFDGGKLNELADAKILVKTEKGQYEIVESAHDTVLHMITKYFKNYFDHLVERADNGK